MSDDADIASDREEIARAARIAADSKPNPASIPKLGCMDCFRITQAEAKKTCEFYSACVKDWQRIQLAKQRNGNDLV